MPSIRLIHWNADEARERAERLAALGYDVRAELLAGPMLTREIEASPPDAVVIDLSRLPSQGREVAVHLRMKAATRRIPLVFVGGDPAKVEPIRALLPDAVYTSWDLLGPALAEAIAHPPAAPTAPDSVFAPYANTPLVKKLGIKPGMTVGLLGAPEGFAATLGELPAGASLRPDAVEGCGVALWFARRLDEVAPGMAALAGRIGPATLWAIWPKKGSALASDITQQAVREAGLAVGLVDFKICAVDAVWTGLAFKKRK